MQEALQNRACLKVSTTDYQKLNFYFYKSATGKTKSKRSMKKNFRKKINIRNKNKYMNTRYHSIRKGRFLERRRDREEELSSTGSVPKWPHCLEMS